MELFCQRGGRDPYHLADGQARRADAQQKLLDEYAKQSGGTVINLDAIDYGFSSSKKQTGST